MGQKESLKNWVEHDVEGELGVVYGSAGGSWALDGLGGNSLSGTNEAKALGLTLKGIQVRLSPRPLSPGPAWWQSLGLLSGIEVRSRVPFSAACLFLLGALVILPHFSSPAS